MPRRTHKKRGKKRGRTKRHWPRLKERGIRGASTSPLMNRLRSVMKFETSAVFDPNMTNAAVAVFSANGIYGPYLSSPSENVTRVTDHQPRGFDQLAPLYDHHVVIASRITAVFNSTDNSQACNVWVSLQNKSALLIEDNKFLGYAESDKTLYEVCDSSLGGKAQQVISMNCSPARFLARSKMLSDPDVKGSDGSNPAEQCFFHVGAQALDETTNPAPLQVDIQIEYVAIFIEPRTPAIS